jgi:hypothetical protein
LRSKPLLLLAPLLFLASTALAEDAVKLWGNYYKERSTRIVSPVMLIEKSMPTDTQVEVGYLVDQITSASSGFTKTDTAFQEYRHDLRVAANKKLGPFTPGASFRYSTESDYVSAAYGLSLNVSLLDDMTTLSSFLQYRHDVAGIRGRASFQMPLDTWIAGLGLTQILTRSLLGGVSFEAHRLRGYQENPYRVENHPHARDRYALAFFLAKHLEDTDTTLRVDYRFYSDTWQLIGHTFEIEATQMITSELSIAPHFRYYTQNGVFFVTPTADGYLTNDPKLRAFDAQLYGLGLRWGQSWLRGSFLDLFAESTVEPSYAYLNQHNSYGPAHIAELGWYWPF